MRETFLKISRGGFPPLSARGCEQTLSPITPGNLKRTVNGNLVFLGRQTHRKYQSILTCEDTEAPALEGLWRGEELEISCIQRLWQKAPKARVVLERPPRPESLIALNKDQETLAITLDGQQASVEGWDTETFIGYHPILVMRVIDFNLKHQEWQEKTLWTLMLEEA